VHVPPIDGETMLTVPGQPTKPTKVEPAATLTVTTNELGLRLFEMQAPTLDCPLMVQPRLKPVMVADPVFVKLGTIVTEPGVPAIADEAKTAVRAAVTTATRTVVRRRLTFSSSGGAVVF